MYSVLLLLSAAGFTQAQNEEKKKPPPPVVDKMLEGFLDKMIERLDTNKDGKIAKTEAKDRIAENFATIDRNKDGLLDRVELRPVVEKFLGAMPRPGFPGPGGGGPPDFDALDKNADGRLTASELKGTRFEPQLDAMDANKDGRVDRREFEKHFRPK